MALTKGYTAITQLTSTGNSTDIDVSDAYDAAIYVKHVNGTGTITAVAQIDVRVQVNSQWYVLATIYASDTASDTQTWAVPLPPSAQAVDLDYTAPTGSSGHTLDAEVGEVTAL